MSEHMIRVDRGDGKLFAFAPGDVAEFLKANPGAEVLGPRVRVDTMTPAEVAATEVALSGPVRAPRRGGRAARVDDA